MDSSAAEVGSTGVNFSYAFNDSNFSDRVLYIEIIEESPETSTSSREDTGNNIAVDVSIVFREEIILNQPDCIPDDGVDTKSRDEFVASIQATLEVEAANDNDSNRSTESSTYVRVKTLHISSPILAAKSPFFYKLFSNGMKESGQRNVSLCINASEEAALMELLNFMYNNTLVATTAPALLDVLMAADKFEVASCMKYCTSLLRDLPMTLESALLYVDLPSTVLMAEAVQPLTHAAKEFLVGHYKDLTRFEDEVLNLPLAGLEAIVSSNDLQVPTEDAVYDIILKWAINHYPNNEDRKHILTTRLAQYIRFPYMTCGKLNNFLRCNEFDHAFANKTMTEALAFKAVALHRHPTPSHGFMERAYHYRPIRVVTFNLPCQQCVVYMELRRQQCSNLYPSGKVYSCSFLLGGQGFFLWAQCRMDPQSLYYCFGLFLGTVERGPVRSAVDLEFAVRSKPTEEFVIKRKGSCSGNSFGCRDLFGIPWSLFLAEDSVYFINDVLYLRAQLTIHH